MNKSESKAKDLAENWGSPSVDQLVEDNICSSITPGICMNDHCDYTTDVEPDCRSGYCEICHTQSVESILSLKGYA